jgi:2-keto-4-pentenoate hydratase/2-oxohepta-3-ene-1,7-dioic acid hydratase in catechol pathway
VRFGRNPPTELVIYLKPRTCLIGPTDDILCPKFVKQLDYEGELALTIGRKCKNVSIRESSEYIAGYFVLNYVSARDQLEIFSSSTSNIPGLRVSILLIPVDHGLTL